MKVQVENIGFPQVMNIMEHMPAHVFSAQSITAMTVMTQTGSGILATVIDAKGTIARIVWRSTPLIFVIDVVSLPANIAPAAKNVTNVMKICVRGVLTMMVLNAYIVAYYTVTAATGMVTGGE